MPCHWRNMSIMILAELIIIIVIIVITTVVAIIITVVTILITIFFWLYQIQIYLSRSFAHGIFGHVICNGLQIRSGDNMFTIDSTSRMRPEFCELVQSPHGIPSPVSTCRHLPWRSQHGKCGKLPSWLRGQPKYAAPWDVSWLMQWIEFLGWEAASHRCQQAWPSSAQAFVPAFVGAATCLVL